MSQKQLNTTKQYQQAYQPLPTDSHRNHQHHHHQQHHHHHHNTMNNPALNTEDEAEALRDSSGLPTMHSSQQLIASSSESDSFNETPDNLSHTRHATTDSTSSSSLLTYIQRVNFPALITMILCFVNLINYMDRFTVAGVLNQVQLEFNISNAQAGFLQTAFVISYMIFAPLFGYLGDRHSRILIMAIGVFFWSATTLAGSFATNFIVFTMFRAFVGIGEASYSTIAPTIISDLFVDNKRSIMLAVFYFAIPVGSGLGYIVGSTTASLAGNWRWALRVTPVLGSIAVFLVLLIKDPPRGESEGNHGLRATSLRTDLKALLRNRSFMLSTAGFTCVSFVAGALAWWGPKFIHLGIQMQNGPGSVTLQDVSFRFGVITMIAGIVGVALGLSLSTFFAKKNKKADPMICGFGLLISAPLLVGALILVQKHTTGTYILVFLAQVSLNVNWSIVADILLYVVIPTRRSIAEAFQILISHALGDAFSPYLVGLISDAVRGNLSPGSTGSGSSSSSPIASASGTSSKIARGIDFLTSLTMTEENANLTRSLFTSTPDPTYNQMVLLDMSQNDSIQVKFTALQYALFITCFVEVLGGIFFLINAAYITRDKQAAADEARAIAAPNN